MESRYREYLSLLSSIGNTLGRLSELSRQKTAAVQQDDLAALDQVMKQEQVLALDLRGKEQKRMAQLAGLGLTGVSLSALPEHCPDSLRLEAKTVAEDLRRSYEVYRSAAEVARNTLECNLHQIEKFLAGSGAVPAGPGYASSTVEPPPAMKTDFRA